VIDVSSGSEMTGISASTSEPGGFRLEVRV
jgi:hypothetical protein